MKRIKLDGEVLNISEGVPILHETPNAVEFYSKYFEQHQPVLIRNALNHWPALFRWKLDYLYETVGEVPVYVEIRPKHVPQELVDDRRYNKHFTWPLSKNMLMRTLIERLLDSKEHIHNLRCNFLEHFSLIARDLHLNNLNFITDSWGPSTLDFCLEDGRAVSGLQINRSENLYVVISGYKKFILVPPFQKNFVPFRCYPAAKYFQDGLHMYLERMTVYKRRVEKQWIAIDPLKPDFEKFPQYKHCTPLEVRVNAGELLYLPRYYLQHVRQSDSCISLNGHYEHISLTCPRFAPNFDNSKLDFKPFGCF